MRKFSAIIFCCVMAISCSKKEVNSTSLAGSWKGALTGIEANLNFKVVVDSVTFDIKPDGTLVGNGIHYGSRNQHNSFNVIGNSSIINNIVTMTIFLNDIETAIKVPININRDTLHGSWKAPFVILGRCNFIKQ